MATPFRFITRYSDLPNEPKNKSSRIAYPFPTATPYPAPSPPSPSFRASPSLSSSASTPQRESIDPELQPAGFAARHPFLADPLGEANKWLGRKFGQITSRDESMGSEGLPTNTPYPKANTPWMNAYLAATQGGAFKPSKTTQDFSKDIQNEYPFTQVKSPFFSEAFDLNKMLSTESPVGVSADSPLGRSDAQNSAQRGDTYSEALKAAQEDIQKPQKFDPFVVAQQDIQGARERSAGLANMTGFNREVGRDYEPVTQSDEIVGMKAKRKSNEDITQQELDRKSWVSPEYLKATESGSVFTPRLDKFKAMQDPAAMVHSWDRPESAYAGKTNTEMRQIAKDLRGGESNVGRVLGAQTMTTGSGVQTRYTPANITSSQDAVRKASEATVVTERVVGPDGKEMVKMKGTSSAPLQKRTDQVGPEPDEET